MCLGLFASVSATSEFLDVHQELYVFSPAQTILDGSRSLDNLNLVSVGEQNGINKNKENMQLESLYKSRMYFGTSNSTTITSQVGSTAHLPCTVHNIGEGVVSKFYLYCLFLFHFGNHFQSFCKRIYRSRGYEGRTTTC